MLLAGLVGAALVLVLGCVGLLVVSPILGGKPKDEERAETKDTSGNGKTDRGKVAEKDKAPSKDVDKAPVKDADKQPPKDKDKQPPPPADKDKVQPPKVGTEFTNSVGMKFRRIPAGKFWMGSSVWGGSFARRSSA